MENVIYCKNKSGNWKGSHCGNVATHQVKLCPRKDNSQIPLNQEWSYRCEDHKNTGTNSKKVFETKEFDQSLLVSKIKLELQQYINKEVYSSRERNKYPLIGRYIKDCGIMCNPNNNTKKWVFVYSHQISNNGK